MGCELCVKHFHFCCWISKGHPYSYPSAFPTRGGTICLLAHSSCWGEVCYRHTQSFYNSTVFASKDLLSKKTREGSGCIRRVPGGNPWRCQTLRCPLLSSYLSLLREVLREGSVVWTSFQALPHSYSLILIQVLLLNVLLLLFCIQNCFIQQIRITSVYIRLLFLT